MKKYILLLLIAFLSVHLLAQDKNQFNPVKIPVLTLWVLPLQSPRGGGMGDVAAATDPDVNSQYTGIWLVSVYPIRRAGIAVSYTPRSASW